MVIGMLHCSRPFTDGGRWKLALAYKMSSYNGWNCRRLFLLPASPMYSFEGVEGLATLTVETWTSLRPEQPNLKSLIGFWQLATVLIMLMLDIIHHQIVSFLLHQCYIQSLHVVVHACRIEFNSSKLNLIRRGHHRYISFHAEVSASLTVMLSVSCWWENCWRVESTGGRGGPWG